MIETETKGGHSNGDVWDADEKEMTETEVEMREVEMQRS